MIHPLSKSFNNFSKKKRSVFSYEESLYRKLQILHHDYHSVAAFKLRSRPWIQNWIANLFKAAILIENYDRIKLGVIDTERDFSKLKSWDFMIPIEESLFIQSNTPTNPLFIMEELWLLFLGNKEKPIHYSLFMEEAITKIRGLLDQYSDDFSPYMHISWGHFLSLKLIFPILYEVVEEMINQWIILIDPPEDSIVTKDFISRMSFGISHKILNGLKQFQNSAFPQKPPF